MPSVFWWHLGSGKQAILDIPKSLCAWPFMPCMETIMLNLIFISIINTEISKHHYAFIFWKIIRSTNDYYYCPVPVFCNPSMQTIQPATSWTQTPSYFIISFSENTVQHTVKNSARWVYISKCQLQLMCQLCVQYKSNRHPNYIQVR